MAGLDIGALDRRVRIEKPVADSSFDGAGSGSWALVATVWAQVQDVLPSRGESVQGGFTNVARPARVRMHYRTGITPDMRIVMGARIVDGSVDYSSARIMQIIAGPAEMGRREGLELMVSEFVLAGNPA